MQGLRTLVEKLNDTCASALEQAAVLAAARGDYEVRLEHVLIKLLGSDVQNDLQAVLEQTGISEDCLFDGLMQSLQRLRTANPDRPVFSTRLVQWLEQAWVSSTLHYQSTHIRSVHLLDALLELLPRFGEVSLEPLQSIGLTSLRDNASHWLMRSVEHHGSDPEAQVEKDASPVASSQAAPVKQEALDLYCQDFTELARQGEMDPISGRGNEIRMAIDILCRRRKNNPILVGEPGVGKTAVVEGLAQMIVQGMVPPALQQVRLLGLDLGQLQAGASVKGEFERRLKQVISEIQSSPVPIILFIDEAHTLIGAGGEAGQNDAANLLKPALARGGLRTIAATTWAEYKRYFERDAALDRRFQRVPVDEPDVEQALLMLSGLKHKFAEHHGVHLSDEALQAAVTLSQRYIPARQLPDKAIDVLDTAAARVRLSQSCPPAQLDQGKEKVRYLSQRLEALEQDQAKGLAASAVLQQQFRESQADTEQRNAALQQAWQKEKELVSKLDGSPASRDALYALQGETPLVYPEVTATTVAEVIADWTGIPLGRMQCDELTVLQNLESHLAQRVTGQESALGRLAQSLRTARSGLRKSDAPLGVFLLAGPSGVGKTETARALAENLFGGERSLVTINMSEYQESHTVSQLKGSPPGYVGYGEGGVLSEAVRQRPYSVVLLDEVEKAHPDVMNLFYQVFDRGILRDGEGREIDFRNTVILMTSNLGSDILMQEAAPLEANESLETEQQGGDDTTSNEQGDWIAPTDSQLIDAITPALRQHFAAALLARMQVIPFRPLDEEALATVVAMRLEAVAERLQQAHDMTFRVDRQVVDLLTRQCQVAENGARQVEAMIEQQLLPGLSRQLLGYMAEDNLPDILTLTLSDDGEIDAIFSDRNIPEEDALSA
ncbi:heat shock protein ClpB-like [Alcanivorax nanhaiticus]|uniref:Heat shock protein ClpB-like n=1 Tax=Alcanivorax nanhaiticus TaxID=1177154 RepID=A0A095SPW5_9GAMM|nr:type VI secretion system ATPase TssH [Alcanivorax nanhaiticus]KGD66582.1 heat shock protein ClpB-like [Alcanivorax nanhaiticus]